MQRFFLKIYVRSDPKSSVGKKAAEWIIEAETDTEALVEAQKLLDAAGFSQPKDFASLRDEAGVSIREWVRRA